MFLRSLQPPLIFGLWFETLRASMVKAVWEATGGAGVIVSELGKMYHDRDIICRPRGQPGDCMYVIRSGRVEVSLQQATPLISSSYRAQGHMEYLGPNSEAHATLYRRLLAAVSGPLPSD